MQDQNDQAPQHSPSASESRDASHSQPDSHVAGEGGKQSHENRENPLADQVPGHLGYSRENLKDVVTTHDDQDASSED